MFSLLVLVRSPDFGYFKFGQGLQVLHSGVVRGLLPVWGHPVSVCMLSLVTLTFFTDQKHAK